MNGTIEVGDNLDLLALHASDFMLCSLSTIINREKENERERERLKMQNYRVQITSANL